MQYTLEKLIAQQQVVDVIHQLFIQTDCRNWQMVQKCFTDEVKVDLTSLNGGEAQMMKPVEIVDAWDIGFAEVAEMHHQLGNFVVDIHGDGLANVQCYCIAYHFLPENPEQKVRMIVGNYEFDLMRAPNGLWCISAMWFTCKFAD